MKGVDGIQPEAIEMKLFDPVTSILDKKLPHLFGAGSVEIDRLSPFVGISIGEVFVAEGRQIVSIRSQMVVHNVENHTQASQMRLVHKPFQGIGLTVHITVMPRSFRVSRRVTAASNVPSGVNAPICSS